MPLALSILFERILHRYLLSTEELSVHIFHSHVCGLKIVVRDEPITL